MSQLLKLNENNFFELLKKDLSIDVIFEVGEYGQTVDIPAHKLTLGCRSDVFYAMFYGPHSKQTRNENPERIKIVDIKPEIFKGFIEFLYTSSISNYSSEENSVYASGILKACRKYLVKDISKLYSHVKCNLGIENVHDLYADSFYFNEEDKTKCLEVMLRDPIYFMESPQFLNLNAEMIKYLLEQDNLIISEIAIFLGVMKWAKHQCMIRKVDENSKNLKNALGSILETIRFPQININEFYLHVIPSGILTEKDIISTLLIQNSSIVPPDYPFKTFSRTTEKFIIFDSYIADEGKYVNEFAMALKFNKEVNITGFEILMPKLEVPKKVISIKIEFRIHRGHNLLIQFVSVNVDEAVDISKRLFICLDKPLVLKDDYYQVTFIFDTMVKFDYIPTFIPHFVKCNSLILNIAATIFRTNISALYLTNVK